MAIFSASILNRILKSPNKSYFVVEMPNYKLPMLKNVGITVWEKTLWFVIEAGKIILAISILLWFMASFGPGKNFSNAKQIVTNQPNNRDLSESELENKIAFSSLIRHFIR